MFVLIFVLMSSFAFAEDISTNMSSYYTMDLSNVSIPIIKDVFGSNDGIMGTTTNAHTKTIATSRGASTGVGVMITPDSDVFLYEVNFKSAVSATGFSLSTPAGVLIRSATVSGDTATFSPPEKLSAGTQYFLQFTGVSAMYSTAGVESDEKIAGITWSGDPGIYGTTGIFYGVQDIKHGVYGFHDGTITGATYTTDSAWGKYALDFDGVDDYVDIG